MYNKPQQVSVWPGEWAQRSFSQKNMFLCFFCCFLLLFVVFCCCLLFFVVVLFFRGNLTEIGLAWTSFFWMIMESFMSLRRSEPVLTGERLSIIHGWMDGWMVLITMDTMDESNITQWWCNCGCILVLDQIFLVGFGIQSLDSLLWSKMFSSETDSLLSGNSGTVMR